jgi:hypothetical protein
MTPRSIRRAAERRANKLARKAGQPNIVAADTLPAIEEEQETVAAIAIPSAADANAQLTAITSSLTGHTTLLPNTGAAQYDHLLRDYEREFKPVGLQEAQLVQTLAENNWRMRRIMALEMGIFAQGRIEFAAQFAEHKAEIRDSLIEVHTFLTYEKQIHSLQLQEARLSRRTDKATAELRQLQRERAGREKLQPAPAVPKTANGFVFSNPDIPPATHFTAHTNIEKDASLFRQTSR